MTMQTLSLHDDDVTAIDTSGTTVTLTFKDRSTIPFTFSPSVAAKIKNGSVTKVSVNTDSGQFQFGNNGNPNVVTAAPVDDAQRALDHSNQTKNAH